MRILHCCLSAFYIDNYSYQENILPRMHKMQGHEVAILASTETFIDNYNLGYLLPCSYKTNEKIPITRLPYTNWLPHKIAKKLRIYKGVSNIIQFFKPDIIFLHDLQFLSIIEFSTYAKNNPNVVIYVDGHTDFINSAKTWISKNILHRIIYKWCANRIKPYVRKFYGTLPARVDFFKSVYGIPEHMVELLVMGADLSDVDFSIKDEIRTSIRKSLEIDESDFLIISGGKIDTLKNINLLMIAVNELKNKKIKLIIFGNPSQEIEVEIEALSKSEYIRNIGWIPSEKIYKYFLASDLAFFPGTHSVLWEQAVGLGLPCVFKMWDGIQHMDVGGNCQFINEITIDSLKESIERIYKDADLFDRMKQVATSKGISEFSYYEIAKRAIE